MAFPDIAPRRGGRSLGTIVGATIGAAVAINSLLFALGWAGHPHPQPLLPPGWVIAGAWLVLLALLAVACWILANRAAPEGARLAPWVLVLIGACLAYPFYTLGFRNEMTAFIGNLATIAGGAFLAGRVAGSSRTATGLILLTVLWVSFATFATFGR